MPANRTVSMIILAGGLSSRMGTDKACLSLNGKSFLNLQIEKGKALGIEEILVSGYRGDDCGETVLFDNLPGKGPLGGLETCLRRARNRACLVLSVDVPLVPVCELEALVDQHLNGNAKITLLKHGDRDEPLVAVYDQELADEMLEEITQGKGGVFFFCKRHGYDEYISTAADEVFENINEPSVYRKVSEKLAHRYCSHGTLAPE